jgi:hypothetical protein
LFNALLSSSFRCFLISCSVLIVHALLSSVSLIMLDAELLYIYVHYHIIVKCA